MYKRYIVRKADNIYAVSPWVVHDTYTGKAHSYWPSQKGAQIQAATMNDIEYCPG